ncbi:MULTISPECIES: ribosome biogenesis GTPase Der [Sporomusa]|jgi:GTP-binding protein|uniref:GTPase Der n=2 Tax=Sporomusa TaxID=2375 RepID=A0ABP2C0Z8_9FIRM|nr:MULTISPECIES: ribosome biogenesis GTPase Der [Sporomusa]MCM0760046.1 ribosome biogenesis GTPase Der [Sporomusa sphaeroides DSM 2875]OLS58331.1 GTPase Der [Sporomusa sphaeroides DSM 2875]CVK17482.1 GTPase Der [Sporomusa sphaeroides DSM 2875]SCM80311.1 GTPase Der [uncultured Sporomusa sp.]HML31638.1 ribosome biogenesis GTPase Der [Sporomusa sphaeroides]
MSKPIVAIVGRPNVGKSTLFNYIGKSRLSIVEDIPGVTRDRIYMDAEWLGRNFTMIDTGGIEFETTDKMLNAIRNQAKLAIEEADVIMFIVDGKAGLTSSDNEVAVILRNTRKPVLLVVNKVDNMKNEADIYEFYNLGLGDPIAISAANALNIGDMLDRLIENMPQEHIEPEDIDQIKVAVIGRPNVGKSSLVNSIIGEERVIVSDIPGTTRDAIDTHFTKDGQSYVLIDTAGMRRKAKIDMPVERYSVIRSLRAVDRCDVVLMVINAEEGVTEQDKKIAGYAHEAGKASIIVVNKWDLIEKDGKTSLKFTETIREELGFMQYSPVLFTSALTKQRVHRVTELVKYVADQHSMRVATSVLNQVIEDATAINPPPSDKGRRLKIYFTTQPDVKPPTFVFFVNDPEIMHFSYLRFLENKLREAFGFEGTPLKLVVRGRKDKEE